MAREYRLDLGARNVLAADLERFAQPPVELQVPVLADEAAVARVQPAGLVDRCLVITGVALHHRPAADADLAC